MKEIEKIHHWFRSLNAPYPGVIMDLVESTTEPGAATVLIYRDNLKQLHPRIRMVEVISWLNEELTEARFNGMKVYVDVLDEITTRVGDSI